MRSASATAAHLQHIGVLKVNDIGNMVIELNAVAIRLVKFV
jgi:hypothetical protein